MTDVLRAEVERASRRYGAWSDEVAVALIELADGLMEDEAPGEADKE